MSGQIFQEVMLFPEVKPKYRKAAFKKPEAVKLLERFADAYVRAKHPTCPHFAPRKFRYDTANGLSQCIVQYIVLCGGFASRINNQGTYSINLKRYIPGTFRKGLSDVMATHKRLSLHIEVKIGKDRLSEAQKIIESVVTRTGGHYYLARNFSEFKEWFNDLQVRKGGSE